MHELCNGAIFIQQDSPPTRGKEKRSLGFCKISANASDCFGSNANQKAIMVEEPFLRRLHCIAHKASNINVTIWSCLPSRETPTQDDTYNVVVVQLCDKRVQKLLGQSWYFITPANFFQVCWVGHIFSPIFM
jgi:hypothetical protein